jgi:OmpA-OmpF porin, OOP family
MSITFNFIRNAALGSLALILATSPALAKDEPRAAGPYVGVAAGVSLKPDTTATATAITGVSRVRLDNRSGAIISGVLGYDTGNGPRAELEVSWRRNSIGAFSNIGTTPAVALGSGRRMTQWSVMANGLYDIDIGSGPVHPYLGVGVGLTRGRLTLDATGGGLPAAFVRDSSTRFAYQGIVGVGIDVMPNVSFDLAYKHMRSTPFRFDTAIAGSADRLRVRNINNSVQAGFRVRF